MRNKAIAVPILAAAALAGASPAAAYVGPGLASSVASVLHTVAGIVALIAGVIFVRPALYLLRRLTGRDASRNKARPGHSDRQHGGPDGDG